MAFCDVVCGAGGGGVRIDSLRRWQWPIDRVRRRGGQQGQICSHGVCVPGQQCATDNNCENDTYCKDGQCVPWDDANPKHDPTCVYITAAGILSPRVRCEFSKAPDNDPFPAHVDVQATPIVVNFNGFQPMPDGEPIPIGTPSIAASFTATVANGYTENLGVIR